MIMVKQIPQELLEILEGLSDWFFSTDITSLNLNLDNAKQLTWQEATSAEYLQQQQNKNRHSGFPDASLGIDLNCFLEKNTRDVELELGKHLDTVNSYNMQIQSYLNCMNTALMMYYPPGGFIDWHTNDNAFGYNALLTYSKTGEGAFLYQHPITKEIITMPDQQGWSMKVGVYDVKGGRPLWHSAYTLCERLNWAYIIPDNIWNNLTEELDVDLTELEKVVGDLPRLRAARSTQSMYHFN